MRNPMKWQKFAEEMKQGIFRFAGAFVLSWLFFGVWSIQILYSPNPQWAERTVISLGMGMGFSVLFVLIMEKLQKRWAWIHCLCLIPMIVTFFLCPDFDNDYRRMGYWGIMLALLCGCVCMLFTKENSKWLMAHLIRAVTWTPLVASLLTGGVMLCVWAVDLLIVNLSEEVYLIVLCWIWSVFFINLFLTYLPKGEAYKASKLYKVLVLYVGLPVYLLLLSILLVYLAKIVITRNMPVGQINWFASFASLFFVFFSFAVRPYEEEAWIGRFQKAIGFVILPIIAMQLIAIYERVVAYGMTTPRTASLILVAISAIFALFAILRKRSDYLFALVGAVILVFTLVPNINIIDIPKQSQTAILEECLIRNGMLTEAGIVPNGDISTEDKERIDSAYTYLRFRAEDPLPRWIADAKGKSFYDIFGFHQYRADQAVYHHYNGEEPVNIEGYRTMEFGYWYEKDFGTTEGVFYGFDIQAYCLELRELFDTSAEIAPIAIDANTSLAIRNMSFDYYPENNKIEDIHISGYLLKK